MKLIPFSHIPSLILLLFQQLSGLDIQNSVFSSTAVRVWWERQLKTTSLTGPCWVWSRQHGKEQDVKLQICSRKAASIIQHQEDRSIIFCLYFFPLSLLRTLLLVSLRKKDSNKNSNSNTFSPLQLFLFHRKGKKGSLYINISKTVIIGFPDKQYCHVKSWYS